MLSGTNINKLLNDEKETKNKMTLSEIVTEIERMGRLYRDNENIEAKKAYIQYVNLMISDSEKSQQDNLNDYWTRLIR